MSEQMELSWDELGPCEIEFDQFCTGFGPKRPNSFNEEIYGDQTEYYICDECDYALYQET